MFYFNLKIGFIDMFRVLRLQNENKIVEFLTEKFFWVEKQFDESGLSFAKFV